MPGDVFKCVNCIKMDYSVEEGLLPREVVEFDFAEDAMDYESGRAGKPTSIAKGWKEKVILALDGMYRKGNIHGISFNRLIKEAMAPIKDNLHTDDFIVMIHRATNVTMSAPTTQLAEAREVKFTQNLTEPLSIGSHIICTGTPTEDLPWFAINIGCGDPESRGDIAVHFNVRLPQSYVVRNTRRHDKWGSEETTAFRLFPFKVDRPFTIEVLVDEKETLWAVDGEHYCSFAHRSPSPLAAGWLQVTGIRDTDLKIQKTDIYPSTSPPVFDIPMRESTAHPRQEDEPIWRPNVIAKLPNGIPEGYQLVIYGRLRPTLHSFAIDLMDVHREWPRANILLHVNLRAHADAQLARQLVVLNASLGAWGPERRQRSARLVPDTYTTIRLVRGAGEWSVYTDNVLIGELEHRAAPDGVKALRIRGDIYPEDIYVCPSTSSPIQEK